MSAMNPFKYIATPSHMALMLAAICARILLVVFSPTPHGYVYDFYADAIDVIVNEGRLPTEGDCLVCYHPPLFPMIGALIFKLVSMFGGSYDLQHYFVGAFPSVVSIVFCIYAYAIYRRYHDNYLTLWIWALVLFLPVIFIASFSVESDLLASTLIVIAIYYFDVYRREVIPAALVAAGVFAGLAAITKYSGLLICLVLGMFLLYDFVRDRNKVTFNKGLLFAVLCTVFGGYPYISNWVEYGTPFKGNDAWHTGKYYTELYTFTDFSIKDISEVIDKSSEPGILNTFPAYNSSVLTSHYGQLWTDFSFFANPTRHGHMYGNRIYRTKEIPMWIVKGVLWAGLVPLMLSLIGFARMLVNKESIFLMTLLGATLIVYIEWFYGFHIWMLKTKYILHLLPVCLVMIGYGIQKLPDKAVMTAFTPSVVFSALYCFSFAVL